MLPLKLELRKLHASQDPRDGTVDAALAKLCQGTELHNPRISAVPTLTRSYPWCRQTRSGIPSPRVATLPSNDGAIQIATLWAEFAG